MTTKATKIWHSLNAESRDDLIASAILFAGVAVVVSLFILGAVFGWAS